MSPHEAGWPGPSRAGRRRARGLAVLLAVLAHGLVLLLWQRALRSAEPPPPLPPALSWLRILPERPAPDSVVASPAAAPRRATPPSGLPAQPAARAPADRTDAEHPAATATTAWALQLPPPEPPASAPSAPAGSILDTPASRQALGRLGRQPLWSERAALASAQPIERSDRALGQAVQGAAHGDCAKGEFAGGGAGLLSLPFLAVAVARGQCAR